MFIRSVRFSLLAALLGVGLSVSAAAEHGYRQVVDGIAVYLGVMPAQLVRGHPPEHPEGQMHGGAPAGENHVMVALFNAQSGERVTGAEIGVTITGPGSFRAEKKLEPMTVASAASYGNYFYMPGPGPYRIALRFRPAGATRDLRANFVWTRP